MRGSPKASRRGLLLGVALAVAAVSSLFVYGDARALMGKLQRYDVRWFLLGLGLATGNYGLRYLRWQAYLGRIGVRVAHGPSARIFLSGFAMSVTPGKLGEVLKSGLLFAEYDIPVERTAPVVLAERLTDLLALVLLVGASGLRLPAARPIAVASFGIVAALTALLGSRRLGRAVIDWLGALPKLSRVAPRLRDAHDALLAVVSPAALASATLLAVVAWFLECLSLDCILRGFEGASLGIAESTFAYSAPTILGALSMLPGGLVVSEGSMTALLQELGGPAVTPTVAAGCTLLVRLATLWWAVLIGILALAFAPRDARVPPGRSPMQPNSDDAGTEPGETAPGEP